MPAWVESHDGGLTRDRCAVQEHHIDIEAELGVELAHDDDEEEEAEEGAYRVFGHSVVPFLVLDLRVVPSAEPAKPEPVKPAAPKPKPAAEPEKQLSKKVRGARHDPHGRGGAPQYKHKRPPEPLKLSEAA